MSIRIRRCIFLSLFAVAVAGFDGGRGGVGGLGIGGAALVSRANALDIAPLLPHAPPPRPAPAPRAPSADDPSGDAGEDPDAVVVNGIERIRFRLFNTQAAAEHGDVPALSHDDYASTCRGPACAARPAAGGAPRPGGFGQAGRAACGRVENGVVALVADLGRADSVLSRACEAALAGPLTWRELEALVRAATDSARRFGWSLAWAFTPEQELGAGLLTVELIPVCLEDVEVRGACWTRAQRLRRAYRSRIGEVVDFAGFARPNAFINQHPFRTVTPRMRPGESPGTSRLVLDVDEGRRWRFFTGYETTHSRDSGHGRINAGFSMAMPYFSEDIWTVQYSIDDDFDHLHSVSSVYRTALPWSHFFTVTSLWSRTETTPDRLIEQKSRDTLLRLTYTVPLPVALGWTHQLDLGWEWRRSRGEYFWNGIKSYDHTYDAAPFFVAWRGQRPDRFGFTGASAEYIRGFSDWLTDNMDRRAYELHRPGADPDYGVLRLDLRRQWRLPLDFRLHQRGWAQWSPDRLASAAQIFLGGNDSIRGYRESEVAGDSGLAFSNELYSPNFLARACGADGPDDDWELRLLGFWDWGRINRTGPRQASEPAHTLMSGAGLGMRLRWGSYLSVRADYAWRLHDTGIAQDDAANGYWHLAASLAF